MSARPEPLIETLAVVGVREWLDSGLTTLMLSGHVGCGKSVGARLALDGCDGCPIWAKPQSQKPRWISAAELTAFGLFGDDAKPYLECWALVIDDVGSEYADKSGVSKAIIDRAVTQRHDQAMKTIMTTNLEAKRFREVYGERIYDRIRGEGRWIHCGNKSLRGKDA